MKKLVAFFLSTLVMYACTGQNNPSTPDTHTDGELNGVFSISHSTQVHFSQGNLQYQPSTNIWRFAEHQYDAICTPNSNIPSTYSGWLDLFRWGTGANPLLSTEKYGDYKVFIDWGTNVISNGGNSANSWRTLSEDEWAYIFHERNNAETLFGLGCVNEIKGVIILPDNWITPNGLTFNASTNKGLSWNSNNNRYENNQADNFEHNTYNLTQWQKMETAGAVFLPINIAYQHESGYYWSSTHIGEIFGSQLVFDSQYLSPKQGDNVLYSLYVRLIREIK